MAVFKCKMCGGTLDIQGNETIATCEYCGGKQTLPQAKDEIIQNLFNRANSLRLKCEFDKAEQIYEKILQQDNTDAEAHWGIILCKYGIEYVEDPKTFKRIPTCHRTSYDAITADADYLAAIENADTLSKNIYADEAKVIDEIQNKILNVVKNEKPFDVFICYKETDENGKRTVDSSIANDIYYQLTQEGLKVFYAAITLEDKIGQEYEPYIFAALTSAKVMLVIGTKPEYFNAVWVKNEWSRYIKQMKNDRLKLLIPCYKDMDAYELPEEFAHLQAQDISKIGFINDIVRGIKKVTANSEAKPATVVKETVVTSGSTNIAPLLKRAFMFLEDGEFARADDFCEQVLNQDPENAQAYLGKLMAELKVKTKEELKDCQKPFDDRNYYKKALRFADDNLKNELTDFIDYINTRNENAKLESIYKRAIEEMTTAIGENYYKNAADIFNSIREYKDSASLAKECEEKAEMARRNSILVKAEQRIKQGEIGENTALLDHAISLFESIDWMDVSERIAYCQKKIEEIKVKQQDEQLERERKAEAERIKKQKEKKNLIIIGIITISIICLLAVFSVLVNSVIIPNIKYNEAVDLMSSGDFMDAYEAFVALNGYKDSTEKADSIYEEYKNETLKQAKVGGYVLFGKCEQDNNIENGKEPIEWLVLEIENGRALVISKYVLDYRSYHSYKTAVTWDTCELRTWLNNSFFSSSFSSEEQKMIPVVTTPAHKNPNHDDVSAGNPASDKMFLLSITEFNKYFDSDTAECKTTEYAKKQETSGRAIYASWWLRTPGILDYYATYVESYGSAAENGTIVNNDYFVRPAMWIDLNE